MDLGERDVTIIPKSMTVIQALNKITKSKKRPVSAVPVVDEHGKLVANFSASDLRTINRSYFDWLVLPILEYLHRVKDAELKHFRVTVEAFKAFHPITCTIDSTFQSVIMSMVTNKIHRIWVVDGDMKPVGVVSIGDLFKVFLPWAFPQSIPSTDTYTPVVHISYENKTTSVSMS